MCIRFKIWWRTSTCFIALQLSTTRTCCAISVWGVISTRLASKMTRSTCRMYAIIIKLIRTTACWRIYSIRCTNVASVFIGYTCRTFIRTLFTFLQSWIINKATNTLAWCTRSRSIGSTFSTIIYSCQTGSTFIRTGKT